MRRLEQVVVVGGGLAGTMLVAELRRRGLRGVVWIDAGGGERGSDSPCALVQPFAGRSFQPRPGLFEAWAQARNWLESLDASAEVHAARLRRRIHEDATGRRLWTSWQRHETELRAGFPGTIHVDRDPDGVTVIDYGPVYAVSLRAAVAAMRARLEAEGLVPWRGGVERIAAISGGFRVERTAASPIGTTQVVVAAGAGSRALLAPWADTTALEHVEGVVVSGPAPPLASFVVDGGHVLSTRQRVGWGASYRSRDANDDRDHTTQLQALEARLRPCVATWPESTSAWLGCRVVSRTTRTPWIASPQPGLWVFTAFGSQGGLWIPGAARRLAAQLAPMSSN
jgi:glycine/D-amino acid oxidase-like deaminating enzyme